MGWQVLFEIEAPETITSEELAAAINFEAGDEEWTTAEEVEKMRTKREFLKYSEGKWQLWGEMY